MLAKPDPSVAHPDVLSLCCAHLDGSSRPGSSLRGRNNIVCLYGCHPSTATFLMLVNHTYKAPTETTSSHLPLLETWNIHTGLFQCPTCLAERELETELSGNMHQEQSSSENTETFSLIAGSKALEEALEAIEILLP